MRKLFAIIVSTVILSGCTMRVADMTVGSTKNYNINSGKFEKGMRVVGEDKVPVVIFPLGIPNVKTAMDRAIEKNPCSVALADVVISQINYSFLFGQIGYRVEGTEILDHDQPGCSGK
ncbi:lipoprotein [Kosakonia sacchari]|uniref:lipoprotein n=1 Tax=Kosakonia sacchari TaxID=1158459 RepID=UPI0015850179|nr:lipoprotein [Kosakonia sacchari]NUL36651.1 hypothetical protein [Kosakonia sacchari]